MANGEMVEPLVLETSNLEGSTPSLSTNGWFADGEAGGLENHYTM